jgi:protein tyrosine/serine phosphatase
MLHLRHDPFMTARAFALPFRLSRRAILAALPECFFPLPGLGLEARPHTWASRVTPEVPGLPNLYRVTPQLYRSAQPSGIGLAEAEAMGIRTVLSLRQTVRDDRLGGPEGLRLIRVKMKARHVAERDGVKVVAAMCAVMRGLEEGPVLVHCHHGADRTGLIVALYRLLYQGWSRPQAIDELTLGGYGFHPVWANIPRYLATVDLEALRARIEA